MKKANNPTHEKGVDAEMMSDTTLQKLLEYLKSVGWSDGEIVKLLDYITSK